MKKFLFLLASALIIALSANAVPAVPGIIEVTQPDGSKLMMRIIGDEFFNYNTTADGYTIVKNNDGYFVYALSQNDDLVASKVIVHNESERSASERQFVTTLKKGIFSKADAHKGKLKRAPVDAATQAAGLKSAQYDYNNFRGLIVLVDYNDCQFTRSDVQNFYYRMANEVNYTGYTNENGSSNYYGACTGSVRDYYTDNSQGRFSPTFDVVGPVHLNNYSVDDHQKWDNTGEIWAAALNQVNPQVDFSQYDTDNDGLVDMVYFIGAGSGSNSDGSTTHLWPHKSSLYWKNVILDGVRFHTYACSTEYLYDSSYGIFDGIGTICHEFSHVLGLPDLYDTDYEGGGGQSQHPGDWDIMAGGSYQNYSRTPVAYSLYDRYSIGFANAQVINSIGTYSLNQIGSTGEGYIINSPESNVKFYIENRQNTKWDAYAPGHGMIICRVDSTNTSVWSSNDVNCNPAHNYYVLLRAGNGTETEQPSDAFPTGATMINNNTTPNLKTFNGSPCQYNITNIREQNGVITFTIGDDSSLQSVVEDFEEMPVVTSPPSDDVQGVYTKWKFVNSYVTNPGSNYCNGEHSVAIKRPSLLTMTKNVRYVSYMVTFDVYNASTSIAANLTLSCSTDNGETWEDLANNNGETIVTVPAKTSTTLKYTFDMNVPARYRISMSSGATSYKAYIDDFTIYYTDMLPEETTPLATVLSEGVNGEEYAISDDLAVVDYAEYADNAFLTDGNGNWIMVSANSDIFNQLMGMTSIQGGTLKGTLSGIELNPVLTLTTTPAPLPTPIENNIETIHLGEDYTLASNQVVDVIGFWNASEGTLRAYGTAPQGPSMTINTSWGTNNNTLQNGKRYTLRCAINLKEAWKATAGIAPKDYDYDFQNYIGYVLRMPDNPTAITAIEIARNETVNVYNMQGLLLKKGVNANAATQDLRPGIYLVNGKKVIVK